MVCETSTWEYNEAVKHSISHSRDDETPEAKARWFQSLSLAERMDLLCAYTNLILELNPRIVEARDARPTSRTVLASLQNHDVKYVVIGGIAAILHGVPRATFDLDVLVEPSPETARKLLDALAAAGLGTARLITSAELLEKEITIFKDVVRVDVQTKTPGIDFPTTWGRRSRWSVRAEVLCCIARGSDRIEAGGRPSG